MSEIHTPPQLHTCPQCGGLHRNAGQLMDCCLWQHVTPAEKAQMQSEVEAGQPLALVLLQHGAQIGHEHGTAA